MHINFNLLVYSPAGLPDNTQVSATIKAGAVGVFDLSYVKADQLPLVHQNISNCLCHIAADATIGIKFTSKNFELYADLIKRFDEHQLFIIIDSYDKRLFDLLQPVIAKKTNFKVLLEIKNYAEFETVPVLFNKYHDEQWGLILCGEECGGNAGDTSAFLWLQIAAKASSYTIYIKGVGLYGAAACKKLGLAGVILDDQVLLLKESPVHALYTENIPQPSVPTSIVLGDAFNNKIRFVIHPMLTAAKALETRFYKLEKEELLQTAKLIQWQSDIDELIGWGDPQLFAWPIGQMINKVIYYKDRYVTTGRLIQHFKQEIDRITDLSTKELLLNAGSPLARSHNTLFPIVQGPMTRVSDNADFAAAVAEAGGLPFIALALLNAGETERLISETEIKLNGKAWGAGVLGFADPALYSEQVEIMIRHKVPYAIIAGGTPDQYHALEAKGVTSYLHAPTSELLVNFIANGVRKFVFEGRECGGHVGPIHSMPLWESVIHTLLTNIPDAEKKDVQVLFAGGIHDKYSSAIIAVMAAPLTEKGIMVGVLMGSAYLSTHELVSSGGITGIFQSEVLKSEKSVLIESGVGHSNRCLVNTFSDDFYSHRLGLLRKGETAGVIKEELDGALLGRLRIAAKGLKRDEQGVLTKIDEKEIAGSGMFMAGDIVKLISQTQSIKQLHEEVSYQGSQLLESTEPKAGENKTSHPVDIAIIGMSVLVPGSKDLETFWDNILQKRTFIGEIPLDRWDWRLFYNEDKDARDQIVSKWGGFFESIEFDPLDYGIPPKSVPHICVSQLLALEVVKWALKDANYALDQLDKDLVSVIFAASDAAGFLGNEMVLRSTAHLVSAVERERIADRLPEWNEESFPGTLTNVVAGRVANRFDFRGSNYTIDAACASSLAAIDNAIKEIISGKSNMVVVGGVDIGQTPHAYTAFSKTGALSPNGKILPFDENANGIVLSEGLSVIILKKLEDAERDGDNIYAVIKSVAGSSDGRAMGMTAPHPKGQKRSLAKCYDQLDFSINEIDYYEAHGTGTPAGDKAELETISETLKYHNAGANSVSIGSVKSLIGHTKINAGLASVIKTALALHYKVLPPHYGVQSPRVEIKDKNSPLYINKNAVSWHKTKNGLRKAGVSAFGFGGTNYHLVMEEYQGLDARSGQDKWPTEMFAFCDADLEAIAKQLNIWIDNLKGDLDVKLQDLAYTSVVSAAKQKHHTCRLSFYADNLHELKETLLRATAFIKDPAHFPLPSNCKYNVLDKNSGKTAVLFPGQGTQYLYMGRELSIYFNEFKSNMALLNKTIALHYDKPFYKYINPPAYFDNATLSNYETELNNTHIAQPAIGWYSKSYFDLLSSFGLVYDCVAGHSYGEYTALQAAGVFAITDYYKLSELRGSLMASCGTGGAMAAVKSSAGAINSYLEKYDGRVVLANCNDLEQTVISGPRSDVENIVAKLKEDGLSAVFLPVSGAFHSPMMQPAQDKMSEKIEEVEFKPAEKTVYSNVTGLPYPADVSAAKALLKTHLTSKVDFVTLVQNLSADGVNTFIELGPGKILSNFAANILKNHQPLTIAAESHEKGLKGFIAFISQLWVEKHITTLAPLHSHRKRTFLDIKKISAFQRKTSETAWIINGTIAKPVTPKFAYLPNLPFLTVDTVQEEKEFYAPLVPTNNSNMDTPAAKTVNSNGFLEVYEKYQQTMMQFLKTQEDVMNLYLRSGDGLPATPSPVLRAANGFVTQLTPPQTIVSAAKPYESPLITVPEKPVVVFQETIDEINVAQDIEIALLNLIAETTGYPIEILNKNIDIEAELGIDSIKRIEIFDQLIKKFPAAEKDILKRNVQQYVRLKKIEDWVSAIEKDLAENGVDKNKPAQAKIITEDLSGINLIARVETLLEDGKPAPRFIMEWRKSPIVVDTASHLADSYLIIGEGDDGLAEAMVAKLIEKHSRAYIINKAALKDAQSLEKEISRAQDKNGPVKGIIHLVSLSVETIPDNFEAWKADTEYLSKSLFYVLKACLTQITEAINFPVLAVTNFGGLFGHNVKMSQASPLSGSHHGMLSCLKFEFENARHKVVDFDRSQSFGDMADCLIDELQCMDDKAEVSYFEKDRYLFYPNNTPIIDTYEKSRFEPQADWVALITGGARGITAAICKNFAVPLMKFVIVGNTEWDLYADNDDTINLQADDLRKHIIKQAVAKNDSFTPSQIEKRVSHILKNREITANINFMRRQGVSVDYVTCDVKQYNQFAQVIDDVYAKYRRLDFILHGAGVIEDKYIADKDSDSFDKVFNTKVDSCYAMYQKVKFDSLKGIVFFASTAGRFGNIGQTDYAAANEVLNRFAWHIKGRWPHLLVKSFNWGPWSETGMASNVVNQQFIKKGIYPISVQEGSNYFLSELKNGPDEQVEVVWGLGTWDNVQVVDANLE